jgi:drug/metabolite transporter (DMT)-like permease
VLTAFLGKYFFAEQITWQRWLGTIAIMTGMILVGLTAPNTTELKQ